ncbi:histidine/lysine/arginine/ornithine ABC transporter permease HisQ [Mesorhizobium sp. L2C085B000]|uniref:ABC transporter permease n=1 Tax=unclassified Mesorhizobium TaxID=325217 RepID=UPI0003D00223|nr:ABC transporter permease subunit [Mesorhizobium sp. L2C085B000]ESZ07999.1 histidine/lysine/arginine/ornithine ABC transporter permease HisQ [Mesorhizobium sp. L2C085B000]
MEAVLQFSPFLLAGLRVTIALSILSVMVAVALGLLGALAKLSGSRRARRIAELYTTLVRGVPDLVLMLLLYFGGQMALNRIGAATGLWGYVELDAFTAGFLAIGFIFGSYMTETFRGALLAIPRGQIEAGIAVGMGRLTLFRRIIWPQLVRFALPSFTNIWLSLMKTTALVSVMGLEDLVYNGYAAGKTAHQPFTFMFVVLVTYLILTSISDLGLRWLDRRYSAHLHQA